MHAIEQMNPRLVATVARVNRDAKTAPPMTA
jgi:hypothetical protein